MKQRLETLASQIKQEILATGTVTLNGKPSPKSTLNSSPFSGLCGPAAGKLQELAPDLDIRVLSFRLANTPRGRKLHAIAEIPAEEGKEGTYFVDPTIGQYLPEAKLVYGPEEVYPLPVFAHSIRRYGSSVLARIIN